jgi:hypothetical protein
MKEQAIAKIQAEMDASPKYSHIRAVGQLLIKRLELLPQDAKAIMTKGKTIKKACDEMTAEARKLGSGMVAMTDEQGMEIICRYFGMDPEALHDIQPTAPTKAVADPFDVSLDDLLAGG